MFETNYQYEIEFNNNLWTVKSTVLKGCVAQGVTYNDAMEKFVVNEKEWLEGAKKDGWAI